MRESLIETLRLDIHKFIFSSRGILRVDVDASRGLRGARGCRDAAAVCARVSGGGGGGSPTRLRSDGQYELAVLHRGHGSRRLPPQTLLHLLPVVAVERREPAREARQ